MESRRFYVSPEQWKSVQQAVIKYTMPLLLVFLVSVQNGADVKQALYLVYGAALQLAINIISKFVSESK